MIRMEDLSKSQKRKIALFNMMYTKENIDKITAKAKEGKEYLINRDDYLAYMRIINATANLSHELGIYDPFRFSLLYEKLLWCGYLSHNKSIEFSINGRTNENYFFGKDVMFGKSVCLNNCAMLVDLFHELGISSCICTGNLSKINTKTGKTETKYINSKKESILSRILSLTKLSGNHVIVLVKHGNMYFGIDPTNISFLNFTDFLTLTFIDEEYVTFQIKPWSTFLLDEFSKETVHDLFVNSFLASDTKGITSELSKNICDETILIVDKNLSLLDDFHDSIKGDIDIVCRSLKR